MLAFTHRGYFVEALKPWLQWDEVEYMYFITLHQEKIYSCNAGVWYGQETFLPRQRQKEAQVPEALRLRKGGSTEQGVAGGRRAGSPRTWGKGPGLTPPDTLQEEPSLLTTPCFGTSGLQKGEGIHLGCFEAARCVLGVAAPANSDPDPVKTSSVVLTLPSRGFSLFSLHLERVTSASGTFLLCTT